MAEIRPKSDSSGKRSRRIIAKTSDMEVMAKLTVYVTRLILLLKLNTSKEYHIYSLMNIAYVWQGHHLSHARSKLLRVLLMNEP